MNKSPTLEIIDETQKPQSNKKTSAVCIKRKRKKKFPVEMPLLMYILKKNHKIKVAAMNL